MDHEIVPYGPDWTDAVPGLQTHLWSPDPAVNRAYLEWKYLANPWLRPGRIHLAVTDRVPVGMVGAYGARWTAGEPREEFDGPCLGDLVILPGHRSARLVQRLLAAVVADVARDGCPAFVFSAGRAAQQLACLRAGLRGAGVVETARLAPGPDRPRASNDESGGTGSRRAPPAPLSISASHTTATPAPPPPKAGAGLDVSVETTCRPDEMARLAGSTADGRIRHVRDAEFFAWRYRNPLSSYRFLYVRREGLRGFLVLQTHLRRDPGVVNLVDWEAEDDGVFGALLRAAVAAAGSDPLELWAAALTPRSRLLLRDLGFDFIVPAPTLVRAHRDRRRRTALFVRQPSEAADRPGSPGGGGRAPDARASRPGGRRLLDLADWDLRGIYSDFY